MSAANPLPSPLPADLPVNWAAGQTVSPSGTDAGLTQQHGYNYLMQQVNAAQQAANAIGEAFAGLASSEDLDGAEEQLTNHVDNADIHVTAEEKARWDNGSIHLLECTKAETVFQLTGALAGKTQFTAKFNAPAAFNSGDSFTLDGAAYTASLISGDGLPDGMFAAGAKGIVCEVDTENKTLSFTGGGISEDVLLKSGGTMTGQLTAGGTQEPAAAQVRNIYAGTADLTAGTTPLETGTIYLVYE